MKPLKTIVFDFDGTLVDSFPVLSSVYNDFHLDMGSFDDFQNRMKFLKFMGHRFQWKLVYLFFRNPFVFREMLSSAYKQKAILFEGMSDLLSELSLRDDVKLLILSHNFSWNPQKTIRSVLRRNKVRGIRRIEIQTLPLRQKKSVFLNRFIQKHKIHRDSLFFVGDEYSDFLSGLRSRIPLNRIVSYGYDSFHRLSRKIPSVSILRTPKECIRSVLEFVQSSSS